MRLTHLKLAGFKSFVDPVQIPVPGQIVSIVGPNGCGKSNVIDAVRWVLGESSARHLRGETMQDVIFNGAGERKAAARASVELHFDNNLGHAGGQWSSYAEIAVKRVLQRDGDSSYYINNLHVRRRDVADIFLGTGLGGRAYGIIEQGTISRIVEAKPEEIRIFLEEAAGVSKYRERRRETELRIADTRHNLTRVEDICRELVAQVEHLSGQAETARRYHELKTELARTQQLLWYVKKQEASNQRARLNRDLQRLSLDLESEITRLRGAEKRVEQLRADHYAAGDALHAAQGTLYATNAEVARLEQELQFVRDNRSRTESRIASVRQRIEQSGNQRAGLEASQAEWEQLLRQAEDAVEGCSQRLHDERDLLPAAEETFRTLQAEGDGAARALAEVEQTWRVEETRREHAEKLLAQLAARRARLQEERAALTRPDARLLADLERRVASVEGLVAQREVMLEELELALPAAEETAHRAAAEVNAASRDLAEIAARLNALRQLQSRVANSERLSDWLSRHGVDGLPRLWQGIDIEAGWEDALEAVLRERLNAVALVSLDRASTWIDDKPPAKLALFASGPPSGYDVTALEDRGLPRLRDLVRCKDPGMAPVLDDWLARVYLADDERVAMEARSRLGSGEAIMSRSGHLFTPHGVVFHAPESELHGVLSRQREIEHLALESTAQEDIVTHSRATRDTADAALRAARQAIDEARGQIEQARQEQHRLQIEHLKLSEQASRARSRDAQIERELAEIDQQTAVESGHLKTTLENLARVSGELGRARAALESVRERCAEAGRTLDRQRAQVQAAEREFQEATFQCKSCSGKLEELTNSMRFLAEQAAAEEASLAQLEAERARFDENPLVEALQSALMRRAEQEGNVAAARSEVENVEALLKGAEEERCASEQKLEPLRDRINEMRLKEQEARLTEESFEHELAAAQADEAGLAGMLAKGVRSASLTSEIARLNGEIEALGAVNLAAVDELNAATERKTYLDAQSADLTQALQTLESAIRRIDRETRERLLATFEEVNRHLGEMFPALFGGGQAKLVLTGDEILDSGVQVIAQPPGKRNTSIHLLSGGEKALAALALVFSLFMLNPAPFCLLDEVDAPLDDTNTERFCNLVKKMSAQTQFVIISHNKITMEVADQLVGVTMQELGVSRVVAVDVEEALRMREAATA